LLPSLDAQRWNLMHNKPEDLRRVAGIMENRRVFSDIPYLAARMPAPQSLHLASLMNTERTGGWAAWSSAQLAQGLKARQYDLVIDRKSTRLNSSHRTISYAVFCLKKKKKRKI